MKKLLFFLAAASPFACSNNDHDGMTVAEVDYDYVVFGDYYGECLKNCIHIYKLENNSMYVDSRQKYPIIAESYKGEYHDILDDAIYEETKDLMDAIPYDILKSHDTVIGQPDAGDWGGIYLEVSIDGEVEYWLIDKMEVNLPENLKAFVAKVNEKLLYLRENED